MTTVHAPAIEAHRLLGDGHTMALLRDDGEIDWWCAPLPHDDPLLWSLLDADGGAARFRGVRPVTDPDADATVVAHHPGPIAGPVLRTVLQGDDALIEVQDALVPARVGGSALVRIVRGREGGGSVAHLLRVGGFGAVRPRWSGGEIVVAGRPWHLHTIGGTTTVLDDAASSELDVGAYPAVLVLTADPAFDVRVDNVLAGVTAMDPHRDRPVPLPGAKASTGAPGSTQPLAMRRADGLAVLEACTYRPTGAVVAAPTTSLPEAVGADRQFDYRYSWLRDGSLASAVAAVVGESDAAAQYLGFLESLGPDRLLQAPLWTVEAAPVPDEREVPGVRGWGGSRPVRIGNEATTQVQYDALGLVAEAVDIFVGQGGELTPGRWALVTSVAERSASGAARPTSGIWEMREPRFFVAAEIGRWMALDHALRLAAHHGRTVPAHWRHAHARTQRSVRRAVRADGLLPQVHSGDPARAGNGARAPRADASALLAIICGLISADDPAAHHVIDRCIEDLGVGPFLHRYPPDGTDGFHGREGPFVPASFWAVTALATVGRLEEATARLEAMDAALPRLLAEEISPDLRHGLGNAPLVWSHIELIRALHALTTAWER